MPIFCVKSVKIYTGQKKLHGYTRGIRDKLEVWSSIHDDNCHPHPYFSPHEFLCQYQLVQYLQGLQLCASKPWTIYHQAGLASAAIGSLHRLGPPWSAGHHHQGNCNGAPTTCWSNGEDEQGPGEGRVTGYLPSVSCWDSEVICLDLSTCALRLTSSNTIR